MAMRLSEIAAAVGAAAPTEDPALTGIATDSREVRPGDLFVALVGEHMDGGRFLDEAFAAGAVAALAKQAAAGGTVLVVDDPRAALLALAAEYRRRLDARVVGITGSVGKTSVKDLTAAVLSARYRVVASPGSYNTEVGLPLTLLSADEATEIVVCEMGSRGRGHVALLAEAARPDVGVVTSVGPAHLELFGSLEAVADAKAELVESLTADGTAVLNGDDPVVRDFAERTPARVLRYGLAEDADVRAEQLTLDDRGRPSFALRTSAGTEHVALAVPGEHMAMNALAACATGLALGLDAGECAAALKEATVSPWRMETFMTAEGVQVINDAYNANPLSTAAALKAARSMSSGACIAVLGEMAELGAGSDEEHERIGELVARLGIDRLIVVGAAARRLAVGATREGVEPDRVTIVETIEEATAAVRGLMRPGDTVLVKGSRRVGLERVAEAFREAGS